MTVIHDLDWEELKLACERNAPGVTSYLDTQTGAVLVFTQESEEEVNRERDVARDRQRYLRIEAAPPREQYRWMEKFVATVEDDSLRERLLIAIDGKGAFRRFKDVLSHYPGERERWFSYRSRHVYAYINEWLTKNHIEVESVPPWGESVDIPNDEPVTPTTVTSQMSPGEVLRRQARELLDALPAVELPAAIAFLEFLRDRGMTSVIKGPDTPD